MKRLKRLGKWRGAVDKRSGRIYYYHTITKEVCWVKPPEMVEQEKRRGKRKGGGGKDKQAASQTEIEAMQCNGINHFLTKKVISIVDKAIKDKNYSLARDSVFEGVKNSDEANSNPILMVLVSQIKTNPNFDLLLTIKQVGDGIIRKEGIDSGAEPSISTIQKPSLKSSVSVVHTESTESSSKPSPRKSSEPGPKKTSNPPPPARRKPQKPQRRGPPPPTRTPPVLPPGSPVSPGVPPPFEQDSGAIAGLRPPPPLRLDSSPSAPRKGPPPAKAPQSSPQSSPKPGPAKGRVNFLTQIQTGRKLNRVKTADKPVPGPPPEDDTMSNALRLKLEDQRKYLAEINESSSEESDWESD